MSGYDIDEISVSGVDVTSSWVLAVLAVLGVVLLVAPVLG